MSDAREEYLLLPDPANLADDDARMAALRRCALPYRQDDEKWLAREVVAARLLAAGAQADPGVVNALTEEYRAERILTYRGEWGDTLLRRAAALPDTPPDLLLWLGQRFPRELPRNPVLPLLTLERPAFFRELGWEGVRRVLRSPDLPATVAGALAGGAADGVCSATWQDGAGEPRFAEDWSLREEARRHVALTGEVAADDAWAAEVRAWYRAAVRDAYAREDGPYPLYYGQGGGKWSGAALERRHLRPDFAEAGLAPPEPVEGEATFAPPEAPAFTPPRPAKPAAIAAALAEAADPATDAKRLFALADESRSWEVKYAVVRHPACGRDTLRRLSRRDCPPDLRLLVLNHPNIPKSLVKQLAVAMDPLVRRAARRHPLADAAVRAESLAHIHYLLTERAEPILTLGPRLARMVFLAGPDADPTTTARVLNPVPGADPASWLDLLAAVLSPHFAPGGALERRSDLLTPLAEDGNAWVRAAARRRLAEPGWTFGPLW